MPATSLSFRLVIVEDHQALRQGLELLLASEGYEILGSASGVAEGRALVARTDPDVVVIDIGLPDGSGIDLTRELLALDPDRGVIIYTGSSEEDLLLDGLDSGARGYALKEGSPQELREAIEAVGRGGTYVDPRLRPSLLGPRATARQQMLSVREREIMGLLAEGLTGEQVADRLFLSAETVKTHVRNAMGKLEAKNRVHAIAIALREGEITLP